MNTIVHHRRPSFRHMLLLVGIAITLPFAVQAGEPAPAHTVDMGVVVNYADLNLTDPAGARTLYARLKRAAEKVCGNRPSQMELRASMAYQDCTDNALNKAVDRVNSQQLYALHAKRGRQDAVS